MTIDSRTRAGHLALTALLAAALSVSVAASCGSRSLTDSLSDAAGSALRTSASGLEAPAVPPQGYAVVKRDGPYWGPYRLPGGRMVYTADTIREYHLEGIVEPGVYGPGDPDPLAALTAASGGDKAASAPPNMDHNGLASPTAGNVKMLILKISWSATATQPIAPKSLVEDKFLDNTADDNTSVKEFYYDQSWGALDMTGDVYPAGEDDAYEISGMPMWNGSLVYLTTNQAKELLNLADPDVDFSQYDYDSNGYVDALAIVYQRFGNNQVSREHVGYLPSGTFFWSDFTKDGTRVIRGAFIDYTSICTYDDGDYAWWDYTPHHEHGHILGLPDLYDYGGDYAGRDNPGPDGDESKGCGFWAIMSGGGYVLPVQNICAPHKYCLGWTGAQMVTENLKNYRLGSVLNSPDNVLRVWKDGAEEQEYFILENNATAGRHYIWYDPPTYNWYPAPSDIYPEQMSLLNLNPGLLIWHVDERVWYTTENGGVFDDVNDWGFGCNDHEERKFIDLEESTATYMLPWGDGDVVDDEGYWGGKYDPWPATYDSVTYNRIGPDTTPDTNAYEDFPDTGSNETGIVISSIERDGSDVLLDISIGAPYVHFPPPRPFVLSGTAIIEPDEVENTEELEYFVDGESYAVFTGAPWGIELDTTAIEYGTIDVRVEARGVLPELVSEQEFTYIVDNTGGDYPVTVLFESEDNTLASWSSNSEGAFERHDNGYESSHSFGVHSYEPPDYPNNLTAMAVLPLVNLPDTPSPTLTIQTHYNLEDGADIASVVISTDYFDADWTQLDLRNGDDAVLSGFQQDWASRHISISDWAGQSVHIGFLLETDSNGVGEEGGQPAGWWLDQMVVATNWAESVPYITSTGLPDPAYAGAAYDLPELPLAVGTANGAITLEYGLYTASGVISGEVSGPPFEENINISALPNQYALLELQVFDDNDVGSPIWEVPVWIYNLKGDIDGDGLVNQGDRDTLVGLLGMTSSDPAFFPWYDTDGNGEVSEADLAAVGYFWSGS